DKDAWQLKVNALAGVEAEYNDLMAIETNYGMYKNVKLTTDLNNNHLHALLDDIEGLAPKSFKIVNLTSDGSHVTMAAVSNERLLSVSALIIQLNQIPMIRNAWVEGIAEDQSTSKGKFRYTYSLTFDFIANELNAIQEVTDTLNNALTGTEPVPDTTSETPADGTTEGGDQ
ncbi:MAG: hypothetical protein VZQ83_09935, partial [Eubacterium sp.]|nr:hypothetical protein [Eubacterium sp.]